MKLLRRTLSLLWKIWRLFSLLKAAWEFIRDHLDDFPDF